MAMAIELPFRSEAAPFHRKLKKLSVGYQEAFSQIQSIAESKGSFAERFPKVIRIHYRVIESGRTALSGPVMSEDVYLKCFLDLLQGWLVKETADLSAQPGALDEKLRKLEIIRATLDALDWRAAQWVTAEKPVFEQLLVDARLNLTSAR
jgi:hypothetical protein